jgi:predicted RNA-binding protein (virulence factor B family)
MSAKSDVVYVSSDEEVPAPSPKKRICKAKSPAPARAKKAKSKYELVADGTRWLREVAEALKKHVIVKDHGDSRDVLITYTKEQMLPEILVEIGKKLEVETIIDSKRSRVLVITVFDYTKDDKLSVLAHPGVVAANVMVKVWPRDVQEGKEVIVPLIEVEREVRAGSKVNVLIVRVYYNMTPTTDVDDTPYLRA